MRGNLFHNPVSLLSCLLVTFKAKSFYIITNSSLPMHCLCYKTQIQQGIKSDCTPSPPLPIPLNSLQVTTVNSLVYILSCPFPRFLHPLPSPTWSCFMNYHLYCSTSCFYIQLCILEVFPQCFVYFHLITLNCFTALQSTFGVPSHTHHLKLTALHCAKNKTQTRSIPHWALALLTSLIPEHIKLLPTLGTRFPHG